MGSEVEEKRQLIKLLLSNLRVEGDKVVDDVLKPFNLIVNGADDISWHPVVDAFSNDTIEFEVELQIVQAVSSALKIVF